MSERKWTCVCDNVQHPDVDWCDRCSNTGKNRPISMSGPLVLRLEKEDSSVELSIEGMGTAGMAEGKGAPIYIEFYDGKWMLHVWADINQEDATHRIDLSGALESNRME